MVHVGTSEDNWEAVPSTIGFGGWNEGSQAGRQAPAPTESSHWPHLCCYRVPRKCPHVPAISNQMVILEEKDFILSILVYPKILCTYTYMQIYMYVYLCVCVYTCISMYTIHTYFKLNWMSECMFTKYKITRSHLLSMLEHGLTLVNLFLRLINYKILSFPWLRNIHTLKKNAHF